MKNCCPPMVMVPLRGSVPALAATVSPTDLAPFSLVGEVIVIHEVCVLTVQLQAPAVNATDPVPPAVPYAALEGVNANEQFPELWLMVKVCPPTEIVPLRSAVELFAAAVQLMMLSPVPLVADVMLIHGVVVVAVQLHDVLRLNDPQAPAPLAITLAGVML